jgi:hypothetical protein
MMLAPSPIHRIGMNARRTATGRTRTGTRVLRTWSRKTAMTRATTTSSSMRVRRRV